MTSVATKPATPKRKISGITAPSVVMESDPAPDAEERLEYIATAAYYKAASRGFMPGEELDDWLEAEAEFDEAEGH
jgi:hypothetical protein